MISVNGIANPHIVITLAPEFDREDPYPSWCENVLGDCGAELKALVLAGQFWLADDASFCKQYYIFTMRKGYIFC